MISICSLAPALSNRLTQIYDELKVCTDDAQRRSLEAERDIKRDLLGRMIEAAQDTSGTRDNDDTPEE